MVFSAAVLHEFLVKAWEVQSVLIFTVHRIMREVKGRTRTSLEDYFRSGRPIAAAKDQNVRLIPHMQ